MTALPKSSSTHMTVDEFLAFAETAPGKWELVDGEPVAMAPANTTHGAIQNEVGRLIANALLEKGAPCSVIIEAGVIPRVFSKGNVRVPDLSVVCGDYKTKRKVLTEPTVLIEILSISNVYKTRANVWAYTSIPSVKEIAVFYGDEICADILRRLPNGDWPEEPERVRSGDARFESIDVRFPVASAYRTTDLVEERR
ncbi:MAG TPA: Uma2 family endonuclease [Methylocystis sp.]|nr:Uma2 family endonuclease [Methylocystis sp.]